jgi:hypothetical protein
MPEQQGAGDMLDRAERAATAGDFASADELLRSAARIQEAELGPLHPDLANTFNNLAIVAEKTGRPGDAETFYRRAVAIASASLPPDHPMVVASRENLEGFCRARGVSIDAPAVITPTQDTRVAPDASAAEPSRVAAGTPPAVPPASVVRTSEAVPATSAVTPPVPRPSPPIAAEPSRSTPAPGRGSYSIAWVATAVIVLIAVSLLILRTCSSRDTSRSAPAGPATPPPAAAPTTIEPGISTAPRRDDRNATTSKPAAPGAVTLAGAGLCRNFSASGRNWRCEPVGNSVSPGPMVFYTRIRSARPVTVVHRWYRGDTLRQSVRLAVRANSTEGYRTYSRQTVNAGDWRVEVTSADGSLLHEQRLTVR